MPRPQERLSKRRAARDPLPENREGDRRMMRRVIKVGAIASAGTKFSGQQTDKRKLRPLRELERPEKLLLCMLQGERDGIYGANWHMCLAVSRENVPRISCSSHCDVRCPGVCTPLNERC